MKAIRIYEYGAPSVMVWEDAADPLPLAGEVVVEVEAAGVNPADYKFRNGSLAAMAPKQMPYTPGMDIAGNIVALGEGVSDFSVGDRVLAMMPLGGNGGYAERVSLPATLCAPIPAGMDGKTWREYTNRHF